MFCYLSCRVNSLRTVVEIVQPIENQCTFLCELLNEWLKKKYIHQFSLMDSDLATSELEVREDAETTPWQG